MAEASDEKPGGEEILSPDSKRVPERADDITDDAQAFVLDRVRSEVHLLLDYISANSHLTLQTGAPLPAELPQDWIEEVCRITWPPQDNRSNRDLARDASLLFRARDYLNRLADPANGSTIAFTLMVTQHEERPRRRRQRDQSEEAVETPWRNSLAWKAYPDLVSKAEGFRDLLSWIIWLPVAWLAFTLFVSWYLSIGNAALTDYAAARTALEQTEARISLAEAALDNTTGSGQPPARPANPLTRARGSYVLDGCAAGIRSRSFPTTELRDACSLKTRQTATLNTVRSGLDKWTFWGGPDTARWGANLLASAVLPVLYGVLGAITAVVLTLSRNMKSSQLRPRDVQLSFQQLALGAVIGACIGLFIPGAGEQQAGTGLLGPVALSSAALSFVAGFGADAVFRALNSLITRIFNPPASNASGGAPTP
jgi:hypothetical protein